MSNVKQYQCLFAQFANEKIKWLNSYPKRNNLAASKWMPKKLLFHQMLPKNITWKSKNQNKGSHTNESKITTDHHN